MKISLRSQNIRTLVLVLLVMTWQWLTTEGKLSVCMKAKEGKQILYRKISGDDGVVICIKNNGKYVWKFLDGSSTLGESFNPAKDCSDIVDNHPGAKDGFYWIKYKGKLSKSWCDTHTDGGGFVLVGMKDSPVTWNVPSNEKPVNPLGPPHWSSRFGDVNVQDFAIQISTTKKFKDTKAHWSYRLKINRALGNLFGVGSGGCTDFHSGIGNVAYVKDILTETVVTTKFNCSKFGPDNKLGWGRMNYCLRNKCPKGYAYFKGFPFRLDRHGSFSYSASSEFSDITHDATAFVGCDSTKCCACFGPKGGRDHYCGRKCKAVNGGTVLTGQVYVWYWIRTRMPKRLWKRCMEFKRKTEAGKFETYYIDRKTGTAHKGTCSEQFETFLNEGTLLVKNKESLDNLPPLSGQISFREDNEKLYVKKGDEWEEIGSEKETENLTAHVKHLQLTFRNKTSQQDAQVQNLETNINTKLQSLTKKISKQGTQTKSLETNTNAKLQSLTNKNSQQDARTKSLETNINAKLQTLTKKISQQDAQSKSLETNINTKLQNLTNKNSQQDAQWQILEKKLKMIEKRLNGKSVYGSVLMPGKSCKDILGTYKAAISGIYWIKLASNKLFQVYCDMETHGGGWTLVYSYTFTNYNNFVSGSNAVIPRPNWPARTATVPISTTPPLSESSLGAVDWNLWKHIGQEVMIKSSINDGIVCQPNVGSLVTAKKWGSINCQNIKNVATACSGVAPDRVHWWSSGPGLLANSSPSSVYYSFEGETRSYWTPHDPCGKCQPNHKKGVSNPGGQFYVR